MLAARFKNRYRFGFNTESALWPMRFILNILAGLLGMIAGWVGLAALVISLSGEDRDGGIAMGALFEIGPIGGVIGFIAGAWLINRLGMVRAPASPLPTAAPASEAPAGAAPAGAVAGKHISRPFAIAIIAIAGFLAWWGWYEFIRSPYLSHGYMDLNLQFELPPGTALPADASDVQINVSEGGEETEAMLGAAWHGHIGDRHVILATAMLSMKTSTRIVTLSLPGLPEQSWELGLSSDPDPMAGFSAWQAPDGDGAAPVEMNFQLTADH
jgi:hypothetical protein